MCFSIIIHEPWCIPPNATPSACDCTRLVKEVCVLANARVKTGHDCGTYRRLVRYNKRTFLETGTNSWAIIPAFDWDTACPGEVISDVQLQHRQKSLAVMNLKAIVEANRAMFLRGKVELAKQMEGLMKVQKGFLQPVPQAHRHRVHHDRNTRLWRRLKEILSY